MLRPLLLAALILGCAPAPNPYLSVERQPVPEGTRLRLVPAAGARINAQQRPVLRRPDSTEVHFDATALTPDSAYFAEPPVALVMCPTAGRVVASVCPSGEYVCRPVIFDIP